MLVFCEECGKRYSFPPEKPEPGSGSFRCRECGFLITVNSGEKAPDEAKGIVETSIADGDCLIPGNEKRL